MATVFEYRLGSTAPLIIQLEQEDGTAPDPVGLGVELHVTANGQCVKITGTPAPDGYEFDISALNLAPRQYPAGVYLTAGNETEFATTIFIDILGGC